MMSVSKPKTRFTRAGDVAIAHQVVCDGPVDLICLCGWLLNIDIIREHPGDNTFLTKLSQPCRLILFDKRGIGMSDRKVGAAKVGERWGNPGYLMEWAAPSVADDPAGRVCL